MSVCNTVDVCLFIRKVCNFLFHLLFISIEWKKLNISDQPIVIRDIEALKFAFSLNHTENCSDQTKIHFRFMCLPKWKVSCFQIVVLANGDSAKSYKFQSFHLHSIQHVETAYGQMSAYFYIFQTSIDIRRIIFANLTAADINRQRNFAWATHINNGDTLFSSVKYLKKTTHISRKHMWFLA